MSRHINAITPGIWIHYIEMLSSFVQQCTMNGRTLYRRAFCEKWSAYHVDFAPSFNSRCGHVNCQCITQWIYLRYHYYHHCHVCVKSVLPLMHAAQAYFLRSQYIGSMITYDDRVTFKHLVNCTIDLMLKYETKNKWTSHQETQDHLYAYFALSVERLTQTILRDSKSIYNALLLSFKRW